MLLSVTGCLPELDRKVGQLILLMIDNSPAICAECESSAAIVLVSLAGASLCAVCVEAYYVACAGCGGHLPQDEALRREGLAYCSRCFSKPFGESAAGADDETPIEALIAEYVELHAEEKRIGDRLGEIKEKLKNAAAARRREGNAVTLRAGEAAIRCSYRTTLKCEAESVAAIAQLLDEAEFSALFERKTSFTPLKERIAEFLASADQTHEQTRQAVRAALRETETVTLSVVPARK